MVYKNPSTSRIWKIPENQKLASRRGAETAVMDQCSFGLIDPASAAFYKKRTVFLGTLSDSHQLSRKCPSDHAHQHVGSSVNVCRVSVKRPVIAGRYPVEICKGFANIVSVAMAQDSSARAQRVSRQSLQ